MASITNLDRPPKRSLRRVSSHFEIVKMLFMVVYCV
jgi:hypothetical protein